MVWFWVQVALAALTVVSTVKAKRDFKKQQKKLNKSQGFQINRFGQDEPLTFVLGERRVAPIFVYRGTADDDTYDDIPNERYAALMVWSAGRITDATEFKMNDQDTADWDVTEFDWVGNIISGTGSGNVNGTLYYNPPTAVAADNEDNEKVLMGDNGNFLLGVYRGGVSGSPRLWGEFNNMVPDDMTGVEFSGVTFSTLRIYLNEDNRKTFSSGEPEFTAKITGPEILTPYGNNGVWGFSQNPIDHLYWYLTDSTIGKGLNASDIDKQSFIDMSRYCNEFITTPVGDKRRFTSNYVIDTSQTHQEIVNDLLMGCHAKLIDSPDGIRVDIDRPKSSVMDVQEGDLVEKIQSSINDVNDRFNEVIIRFVDAELDFKDSEVSFPARDSALYTQWLTEDKFVERIEEIEVETITDYYEALRFAEYIAYKSRNSKMVSCSIGAKGWQLEEGDVITLTSTHRGWNSKPFIVEGITLQSDSVGLDLMEYNAEVYSYITPSERIAPPAPTVKNPFAVQTPTNLAVTTSRQLTVATWDYPEDIYQTGFRVTLKVGSSIIYDDTIKGKRYEFSNLTIADYTLSVRAQGAYLLSNPVTTTFSITRPASPTGLIVTDSYIEWQHPALANIENFRVETTTGADTVAHTAPKNSNTTQRFEITGIKSGDYDVSVIALTADGIESLPTTLTNAQIDGVSGAVNDAVNTAVTGFTTDPHTWTALNNFTGGLQKDGVDVLKMGDYGLGGGVMMTASTDTRDASIKTGFYKYNDGVNGPVGTDRLFVVNMYGGAGTNAKIGIDNRDDTIYYSTRENNTNKPWYRLSAIEKNETITGQKNFTGGLLKNNTDVLSLGDLTPGSSASLVLAESSIEQFTLNQQAGLYDNFNVAEGAIAAGWINAVSAQMNYLISQGANIEKIKSSAIEVSGAGYALNQNPTWQDSLDGWTFFGGLNVARDSTDGLPFRLAKSYIGLTTTGLQKSFFGDNTPVSEDETYTISVGVAQSGNATQYLAVAFIDSNGSNITGTNGGATGWGGVGTYHYFGLVNQVNQPGWHKHEIKIGVNGDATIPTGAVAVQLGMLVNYSGDYANTAVYLQDYRIEKTMGSTSIENGSINADHLVLSGNGSITFDTVGADQAGSAATAETNAKAYAFPASSAGALASRNTVGPTHIDANAVTTPKIVSNAITTDKIATNAVTANEISSDVAVINKLVANKTFGVDATFEGTVYARNLTGDANEFGSASLGNQSITGTGWNNLAEVKVPKDLYLERELTIEGFDVNDGSGCSFKAVIQTQPILSGGIPVDEKTITAFVSGTGNKTTTNAKRIILPANTNDYWISVQAKNNVGSQSPVTSGSITFRTRPVRGTLAVTIL